VPAVLTQAPSPAGGQSPPSDKDAVPAGGAPSAGAGARTSTPVASDSGAPRSGAAVVGGARAEASLAEEMEVDKERDGEGDEEDAPPGSDNGASPLQPAGVTAAAGTTAAAADNGRGAGGERSGADSDDDEEEAEADEEVPRGTDDSAPPRDSAGVAAAAGTKAAAADDASAASGEGSGDESDDDGEDGESDKDWRADDTAGRRGGSSGGGDDNDDDDDDDAGPAEAPAGAAAGDEDPHGDTIAGGDVKRMEAITWGPAGTYLKAPRLVRVQDVRIADVTTRNLTEKSVLHHYDAQRRTGYDWAFGSIVVCHDWVQAGAAVHDDLTSGTGGPSLPAAVGPPRGSAAAGAAGVSGGTHAGHAGRGLVRSAFRPTNVEELTPAQKEIWTAGRALSEAEGLGMVDVNVKDPVVLVDGAHRLTAMKRLVDEKDEMAVEWALVAWGGRRDQRAMTHWDTLNVGAASNDLPAIAIAMSQLDHVVWAVNWVETFNRLQEPANRLFYVPGKTRKTAVALLANRAIEAGVVPMNKEGQRLGPDSLARILKIALLNAISPMTVECMLTYLTDSQGSERKGSRLSVECLVSSVLLDVNVGTQEESDRLRKLMLQMAWQWSGGPRSARQQRQQSGKQPAVKARRLTRGGDVTFFSCVWAFLMVVREELNTATHRLFLLHLRQQTEARAQARAERLAAESAAPVVGQAHVPADGEAGGGAAAAAGGGAGVGGDGGNGANVDSVVVVRPNVDFGVGAPVIGPGSRAQLTHTSTLWRVLISRIPTANPQVVTCLAFHLANLFVEHYDIDESHEFKKTSAARHRRTPLEIGRADPFSARHLAAWTSLVKSYVNPSPDDDGPGQGNDDGSGDKDDGDGGDADSQGGRDKDGGDTGGDAEKVDADGSRASSGDERGGRRTVKRRGAAVGRQRRPQTGRGDGRRRRGRKGGQSHKGHSASSSDDQAKETDGEEPQAALKRRRVDKGWLAGGPGEKSRDARRGRDRAVQQREGRGRDRDADRGGTRRGGSSRRKVRGSESDDGSRALTASGGQRKRRHPRSSVAHDGQRGRGRSVSPLGPPTPARTPKRMFLRAVRGPRGRARDAERVGLSQPSARRGSGVGPDGPGSGQVPDRDGGAAARPYADDPEEIPPLLVDDASSNRRAVLAAQLPGFASLLPDEHQARDFVPPQDWFALEQSVRAYMSTLGKTTMSGAVAMAAARVTGGGSGTQPPPEQGQPGDAEVSGVQDPLAAMQAGFAAVKLGSQLVERGWCILPDASAIPVRASQALPERPVAAAAAASGRSSRPGGRPPIVPLSRLSGLGGASAAPAGASGQGSRARTSGGTEPEQDVSVVHETLLSFVNELPSEEEISKAATTAGSSFSLHPVWAPIHNADQGAADAKALNDGQGRFMVRQKAVRAAEDAAKHAVFVRKLRADMLMAAVAYEVLHMTDVERDADNRFSFSMPRTGARILATTKDAVRQVPHVDFRPHRPTRLGGSPAVDDDPAPLDADDSAMMRLSSYELPQCRDFFMMASGKDSFALVTWPGSVLALARHEMGDGVRRSIYPETVTVPPNSIILVRGDLVHAGASAADDSSRYGKAPAELTYSRSIRMHSYLRNKQEGITDSIWLVDPHVFINSPLIILDDEDVDMVSDDGDGVKEVPKEGAAKVSGESAGGGGGVHTSTDGSDAEPDDGSSGSSGSSSDRGRSRSRSDSDRRRGAEDMQTSFASRGGRDRASRPSKAVQRTPKSQVRRPQRRARSASGLDSSPARSRGRSSRRRSRSRGRDSRRKRGSSRSPRDRGSSLDGPRSRPRDSGRRRRSSSHDRRPPSSIKGSRRRSRARSLSRSSSGGRRSLSPDMRRGSGRRGGSSRRRAPQRRSRGGDDRSRSRSASSSQYSARLPRSPSMSPSPRPARHRPARSPEGSTRTYSRSARRHGRR